MEMVTPDTKFPGTKWPGILIPRGANSKRVSLGDMRPVPLTRLHILKDMEGE